MSNWPSVVEDMLIKSAQTGKLAERVDEPRLIQLLENQTEQKQKTKITVCSLLGYY
jgi:DNA-binding TFAR19-related protein (PDSD5 family)